MTTPSPTPVGLPAVSVFINEQPDEQMRISIQRAPGYRTTREVRYVDAIRELLLKELPALCARVENRPLPKAAVMPHPPGKG
jgi:hypothetical protein